MSAGQKRGGLGQSERWLWERSWKQESKTLWMRNCAGLLTERSGIKRCIFPASSVVCSLRWATSRCSLLLSAAFFLVWHRWKAANPYQAREAGCSLLPPTGPESVLQAGLPSWELTYSPSGHHQSATTARRRPGDMGREVKGCACEALNGKYKALTLSRIRTFFLPAIWEQKNKKCGYVKSSTVPHSQRGDNLVILVFF